MRLWNAMKSACGRWKRCFKNAFCCCLPRRSGKHAATATVAVQTDLSYCLPAVEHTLITVSVDVSNFRAQKVGLHNTSAFANHLAALLRRGVKACLRGVMLTGKVDTAVKVSVFACGYPVTLAGMVETENFSHHMADRFQKVLQTILENVYATLPEHAKHEGLRKKKQQIPEKSETTTATCSPSTVTRN
ncbi:Ba169 [Baboon cytomegalovirus]|nr:Ba169 [Baboon cytomegalovirus]